MTESQVEPNALQKRRMWKDGKCIESGLGADESQDDVR
jgi:hypothetical protein